jgi:hypothetical protein
MNPVHPAPMITRDQRGDAVATAALAIVRRALVEGVPVTRESFAQEASFALGGSPEDALRHVDDGAPRLGISSLSDPGDPLCA